MEVNTRDKIKNLTLKTVILDKLDFPFLKGL